MRGVLLRVLPPRPDPADAPLQAHLLRPLPGEDVADGRHHPQRVLPTVPLDHLHPGEPHLVGRPVGQHGHLGPDLRGAGAGGAGLDVRFHEGFEQHDEAARRLGTVSTEGGADVFCFFLVCVTYPKLQTQRVPLCLRPVQAVGKLHRHPGEGV